MSINDNKSGAGRNGNTPPKKFETTSVCIDYLKIRVTGNRDDDRSRFKKLFEILQVYEYEVEKSNGRYGYQTMMNLFPGCTFNYGGHFTKTSKGEDTSLLEMSGKGCREFEDRYFSFNPNRGIFTREEILRSGWIALIEECNRLDGVATRIDMPVDDMSGMLDINEIKDKISKKEYATRMRKLSTSLSHDEEETEKGELQEPDKLRDRVSTEDAKRTGYSATFGNRDHLQLCIYDKAAEQHNKGNFMDVEKWIRFEVRYYHKNAELLLPLLLESLKNKNFHRFAVGRLKGIFEFKESLSNKNRAKNKSWAKWEEFTEGVSKESGFSIVPGIPTIQSNALWLKKDASLALGKLVSCLDVPLGEMMAAYALEFIRRADNSHLQAINQWRRSKNKEPFKDLKQVKNYIISKPDFPDEIHEETISMILAIGKSEKDDKG